MRSDRLRGIDRGPIVRKNQVPVLGSFEQDLECFAFVHFADQGSHAVPCRSAARRASRKDLARRCALRADEWWISCGCAGISIGSFSIGDDVVAVFAVDAIQKCCQGRGLAACWCLRSRGRLPYANVSDIGDLVAEISKQQDPE